MPLSVLIDTDPGHDDALAILLAGQHLNIVGVTTVAGNQTIELTTRNAQALLEYCGLGDIPVARGCARPLVCPPLYPGRLPTTTGLDGATLPPPARPLVPLHAVDFIHQAALNNNHLAVLALGPLTNVALALQRWPDLAHCLGVICLMGGSLDKGNSAPFGEFNILADPEAAHIVFTSGVPIKMCGLNLTRQVTVGPEDSVALRGLGNRIGVLTADWLDYYCSIMTPIGGVRRGALHDPCAAAWLIDPSLISAQPMHVAIEIRGEHTRGMTVCDYRHLRGPANDLARDVTAPRGQAPNAEVALAIERQRFMALLLSSLRQYP